LERDLGGRPRIIETPGEFDRRVDAYVEEFKENNEPILFIAMILKIGLNCKQSFYDYASIPEFSYSVKRAKAIIEAAYEERMVTNPGMQSGNIFALKNFGWRDKEPSELENLQAEKLKRELLETNDNTLSDKFKEISDKLPN
jgi:hypothetical protein